MATPVATTVPVTFPVFDPSNPMATPATAMPLPDLGFKIPTPQDIHITEVMALSFASIAFVWTTTRLWIRRKAYWWDDLCAGLACLFLSAQVVLIVVNNRKVPLPPGEDIPYKVFVNYMNSLTFLFQDWFARSAILYSVIRITPNNNVRRVLHWIILVFWLCGFTNLFMFIGHCERFPQWKTTFLPLCIVPKHFPIFQMVTGILADALLIVLPIHTLRILTSAPSIRRRLMAIFAASVLLTVATIVQCVFTFKEPGLKTLQYGLVEGFIAVLVCSLAVISMAIMQLLGFHKPLTSDSSRPSAKPTSEVMQFHSNLRVKVDLSQTRYTIQNLKDSDTILGTSNLYATDSRTYSAQFPDHDTMIGVPDYDRGYSMEGRPNTSHASHDVERALPPPPLGDSSGFLSRFRSINGEEGVDQVRTWSD